MYQDVLVNIKASLEIPKSSPKCSNDGLSQYSNYKVSNNLLTKLQFTKICDQSTTKTSLSLVVKKDNISSQITAVQHKPTPPTQQVYELHEFSNNILTIVEIIMKIKLQMNYLDEILPKFQQCACSHLRSKRSFIEIICFQLVDGKF